MPFHLISRYKLERMFDFFGVFAIKNVNSANQMLRNKFEVAATAASADKSASSLPVRLAYEDHPVEKVDVTFGEASPVLDEHVQLAL